MNPTSRPQASMPTQTPQTPQQQENQDDIDLKLLVDTQVIPSDKLDQIKNKWGSQITGILMMTPFVQQRMSNSAPMHDDEFTQLNTQLDKVGEELSLKIKNMKEGEVNQNTLELQEIANSHLGTTSINLSKGDGLKTLLVNSLRQIASSLQDTRLDSTIRSIHEDNSPFDTVEKLDQIIETFKEIASKLPNKNKSQREILTLFNDQLLNLKLNLIKDDCFKKLKHQLKDLVRPGAVRNRAVELQLGTKAGIGGAFSMLSGKLGVRGRFHTATLDDGLIRPAYYCSPKLSLLLGDKKAAQGTLSAAYQAKWSGKSIPSVDNLVGIYAHKLMPLPSGTVPKPRMLTVRRALAQAIQQERRAISTSDKLANLLKNQGVIKTSDKLHIDPIRVPGYAFLSHHSHGLKGLRTSLGISGLNQLASANIEHAEIINNYNRYIDLIQAANLHEDFFEIHPSKKHDFNTSHADTAITHESDSYSDQSEALSTPSDTIQNSAHSSTKDELKQTLLQLHTEFCDYCELVNEYDQLKSTPKEDKLYRSDLKQIKHQVEKARGTKGRGQFIRSIITDHLHVKQKYENLFNDDASPKHNDPGFAKLIQEFEHHYKQPNIYLNAVKDVQRQLSTVITADSLHTFALARAHLNVPTTVPHANISLTPEIERLTVENFINPDLDGTYLKARIKLQAGTNIHTLLPHIDPNQFLKDDLGSVDRLDQIDWSSFGAILDGEAVLELSWHQHEKVDPTLSEQDKPHWELMYVRLLAGSKAGASLTARTGPLLGPLELKAKVGVRTHRLDNIAEHVGDNSLRYMQSKHNGWGMGNKTSGDDNLWQAYKDQNRPQFARIFSKVATQDSNINLEVKQRRFDVECLSPEQQAVALAKANTFAANSTQVDRAFATGQEIENHLLEACRTYRNDPTDDHLNNAFTAFDIFLKFQAHEVGVRAAARFHLKN